MHVKADQSVLISIYLPHATSSATWHSDAFDTSYLSTPGDHTTETSDASYVAARTSWYYLSGIDVVPTHARGTVVAFGDSITDGYNTPAGAYRRWRTTWPGGWPPPARWASWTPVSAATAS